MEVEKGKTFKYLREKRQVTQLARDNLKKFIKIKKDIRDALSERDMTIDELTQKLGMPKHEVAFYVLTLVKYYYYKLKK
jgi:DNA-directed RNA polymerase specialized sigma subunit